MGENDQQRIMSCTPNPGQPGGGVFLMKCTLGFILGCVEMYKRSHSYVFVSRVRDWASPWAISTFARGRDASNVVTYCCPFCFFWAGNRGHFSLSGPIIELIAVPRLQTDLTIGIVVYFLRCRI